MSNKKSFRDLKDMIELKDGEIDELNLELAQKDEKIEKLTRYISKLKQEKQAMEFKIEHNTFDEKARLKELDVLEEKIKDKENIIEDKQDQVKYLRELINDYRQQIEDITENLEVQLRKVSKTYEGLLEQKDLIIEKQDLNIANLIKSIEEINKSNKANLSSLQLQNKKYQKLIDDKL